MDSVDAFLTVEGGDFVHCMGDAHIYLNHIDAVETQLLREPRPFPMITFNKESVYGKVKHLPRKDVVDAVVASLEQFEYSDVNVLGYLPHPKIAMDMSV